MSDSKCRRYRPVFYPPSQHLVLTRSLSFDIVVALPLVATMEVSHQKSETALDAIGCIEVFISHLTVFADAKFLC